MNPDNYASLEASKRLVDAGIMLETDMAWTYMPKDLYRAEFRAETIWKWRLVDRKEGVCGKWFPAPAWPEVWKELPDGIVVNGSYAELYFMKNEHEVNYCGYSVEYHVVSEVKANNPTDALIELLIWVRKEKGNERRTA